MRSPVSTSVAIAVGLVVLLGYFIPLQILLDVRAVLLGWAVALAGTAVVVAVINLLVAHWRKLQDPRQRNPFSPVLLIACLVTFTSGLVLGPANSAFQRVVTHIQIPVEASLMAVLAIVLTAASLRLLQRKKGWIGYIFILSALVFLVIASGFLAIGQQIPILRDLLYALEQLPLAGARGILLGIALGGLTAGLRILLGADRPYSG